MSKTLSQNEHLSITLFSFDKGEGISSHDSKGDAMVYVIDGSAQITIEGKEYNINSGEMIIMPANKPHAVLAPQAFKMLLTVVFKG